MSLIQDALKRKTEEQPPSPGKPSPAPPPSVAPPPARPGEPNQPAPQRKDSSSRNLFLISTVILVLLLLAIGFNRFRTSSQPAPARQVGTQSAKETIIQPESMGAAPVTSAPPIAAAETPALKPEVTWPELTLSGSAGQGGRRMAVINGRMLSAGESVKGVKVIKVGTTTAVLEYNGEQRTLSVDDE